MVWGIIQELGFYRVKSEDFKKLLDDMDLWSSLWDDTVEYDKRVVERVLKLIKGDVFEPISEG